MTLTVYLTVNCGVVDGSEFNNPLLGRASSSTNTHWSDHGMQWETHCGGCSCGSPPMPGLGHHPTQGWRLHKRWHLWRRSMRWVRHQTWPLSSIGKGGFWLSSPLVWWSPLTGRSKCSGRVWSPFSNSDHSFRPVDLTNIAGSSSSGIPLLMNLPHTSCDTHLWNKCTSHWRTIFHLRCKVVHTLLMFLEHLIRVLGLVGFTHHSLLLSFSFFGLFPDGWSLYVWSSLFVSLFLW